MGVGEGVRGKGAGAGGAEPGLHRDGHEQREATCVRAGACLALGRGAGRRFEPVSYTQVTLPTNREVVISGGDLSFKSKCHVHCTFEGCISCQSKSIMYLD